MPHPKLDCVNNNAYTKFGKILSFVLNVLNGNKIMTDGTTDNPTITTINDVYETLCPNPLLFKKDGNASRYLY